MESVFNFLENNSIYIVMLIVLLVWLGIFAFIYSLHKKVKKLEGRINQ